MGAPQVDVANAVVARIAEASQADALCQRVEPQRSYAEWDLELSKMDNIEVRDLDKLYCDVVAHMSDEAVEPSSRTSIRYKVPVDIMLRRKFGQDKQDDDRGGVKIEEVDALLLLQTQIHLLFMLNRFGSDTFAVWDGENGGTSILWAPHRDHLRNFHQFSGLIRIVFRVDVKLTA